MNADGKAPLNVTDNEDIADSDPSWAPDGRILFTSERAATFGIQATDLRGVDAPPSDGSRAPSRSPSGRPTGPASRSCRSERADPTSTCRRRRVRRAAATADAGSEVRRHVPDVVARRATHRLRSRGRVRNAVPLHDGRRRHGCCGSCSRRRICAVPSGPRTARSSRSR